MTTETLFWTAVAIIAVVATVWLLISICIISGRADRAMEEGRREEDEFEQKTKRLLADEKWRARWADDIAPRMDEEVE